MEHGQLCLADAQPAVEQHAHLSHLVVHPLVASRIVSTKLPEFRHDRLLHRLDKTAVERGPRAKPREALAHPLAVLLVSEAQDPLPTG